MTRGRAFRTLALSLCLLAAAVPASGEKKKETPAKADPYAQFVWPPPPDKPRIKLEAVLTGRTDLEGESKLSKLLIGVSPKSPWDDLKKPFAVEFDAEGRLLVTDGQTRGLLRFDLKKRRLDVLGTQGASKLALPMGLDVGTDGVIYVADAGSARVVALLPDGSLKATYGKPGELVNPTDAAVSKDGKQLYVADSKGQVVVVFDVASGKRLRALGKPGSGPGEFAFPTSVSVGLDGNLFVVDQLNARVQVIAPDGQYVDSLGRLGTGFGDLVRPKDVAVDEAGLIYVADNALNNIQIFDADLALLTFVGAGGEGPGQFWGLSGIAVSGEHLAAVDQLGHRLQVFRWITSKTE